MSLTRKLTVALLLTSGIVATPVFSEIETTTTRTTTIPATGDSQTTTVRTTSMPVYPDGTTTVRTTAVTSNGTGFILPSTGTYFVIDPVTGNVIGNFDPSTGLTNTSLVRPGLVIINKESGRVVAAVDPTGRPIELTVVPAFDPFVLSIDTRRANIEAMIADCLNRGTMDAAEAAALRKELNRIETLEITSRQSDGILSYSEALQIALDLNDLQDRLKPFQPTIATTPLLGARMLTTNGQLVIVADVDYRQAKLLQRVDDEYTAGRLSTQQVSLLKGQLNTISALETKYKKNGQLSESNERKISTKLDVVNNKIDQDVAIINAKRAKIGIKVN